MALNKSILFVIALSLISQSSFAAKATPVATQTEGQLEELATKQSIENLRFISYDGRHTYYQRRSGSLAMATNYRSQEILQGPQNTNYLVSNSPARKKIIIQSDEHPFTRNDVMCDQKIYLADLGGINAIPKAQGISPKLHLEDRFFSYYSSNDKTLHLVPAEGGEDKTQDVKIILQNKANGYFIPQVVMLNDEQLLYTDMNSQGFEAIVEFNRISKKSKVLFKSPIIGHRLELALLPEKILIARFGQKDFHPFSSIDVLALSDYPDFQKMKNLYESSLADPGHMLLSNFDKDHVYFVKNIDDAKTEVAKLKLSDKTVSVISKLEFVTQIINVDGRIMLPYRGTFYVVKGDKSK